jgi:hypothetical protein
MSQEWLKQLAELSNDKELRKRAQQLEKKAQRQSAAPRAAGGPQRSLVGAAFGHFFRWLFLFGLAEAVALFIFADSEGLSDRPWGAILGALVQYLLTQPVLPDEVYQGLLDWFGLTQADLFAFYDRINPFIQAQQDALVFYLPAAASLALTLFFLPAINAARRRSPIRFLIWLANWAVVFLAVAWGGAVVVLWLAAFVFSFLGGGVKRAPRPAQPQPATQPSRPAAQPHKAARPAVSVASAAAHAVQRSARPAAALNKREPTVVRRGERSWIRAR